MLDYIYLFRTTPDDEPCAQVGSENYMQNARIEARVYINQLKRAYGNNPENSSFKVVRCPHDFGTYLDLRFYYDDEDQAHVKYVIEIESGCKEWDEQARAELLSSGYVIKTWEKPLTGQDETCRRPF